MSWVDRLVIIAEVMSIEEFKLILERTDVTCAQCGNCCTSTAGRCVYLAEDNKCEIHQKKPTHCLEFPKVWNFGWMKAWNLGSPSQTMKFCGILRKFWEEAFKFMEEKGFVTK